MEFLLDQQRVGSSPRRNMPPATTLEDSGGGGESGLLTDRLREEIHTLRGEVAAKSRRLETVTSENMQLQSRLQSHGDRGSAEKDRLLDQVSRLTGRCEQLEADLRNAEAREQAGMAELERQTIVSKDREKKILRLAEELEAKEESARALKQESDALRNELLAKETQFSELQDKFLQSSAHIMEETIKGLRDENCTLQRDLREREAAAETFLGREQQMQNKTDKLLSENSELRAQLSETRKKLDSEVRARENRDSKGLLETQEALAVREREKALKADLARAHAELEKEKQRAKEAVDRVTRETQQMTSLELRVSTQKSRIAELEGSLVMAQEANNKVRKEGLVQQERNADLKKELLQRDEENRQLMSKLAAADTKLHEADRRVEALATLQSQRWLEFSKMADNMKELSSSMLSQSKSNTRKAAIRADLDEELVEI